MKNVAITFTVDKRSNAMEKDISRGMTLKKFVVFFFLARKKGRI